MKRTTDDLAGHVAKLLPLLALFVRVSVGLTMLNSGLVGIFSRNHGRNPFNIPGFGGGPTTPAGMEAVASMLPYTELALGVGLIFGIFTTITSLLACLISLVNPSLATITLVTTAGIGPGMNQFTIGFNPESFFSGNTGVVAYSLLVALSPLAINRYSIDALIFQRGAAPIAPRAVDRGAAEAIDEL